MRGLTKTLRDTNSSVESKIKTEEKRIADIKKEKKSIANYIKKLKEHSRKLQDLKLDSLKVKADELISEVEDKFKL